MPVAKVNALILFCFFSRQTKMGQMVAGFSCVHSILLYFPLTKAIWLSNCTLLFASEPLFRTRIWFLRNSWFPPQKRQYGVSTLKFNFIKLETPHFILWNLTQSFHLFEVEAPCRVSFSWGGRPRSVCNNSGVYKIAKVAQLYSENLLALLSSQ